MTTAPEPQPPPNDLKGPQESTAAGFLECRGVVFSYPGNRPILRGIDLVVEAGSLVEIRGPSGAGKSTLLRLLNRLQIPDRGSIRFKGLPLEAYPPPDLRRAIGYLQQTPVVTEGSVRENLLLPFTFKANLRIRPPAEAVLNAGLRDFLLEGIPLDRPASALSIGQKQRLCILRTMLLEPEVLLLDEPASALDAESRSAVQAVIEKLSRSRPLTMLLVSHQPFPIVHPNRNVLALKDGKLVPCADADPCTAKE